MRKLNEIRKENVTEDEIFEIRFRYENREYDDPDFYEFEDKLWELQEFEEKVYSDKKYNQWLKKFKK